jgi:uncharacterized protein (DUF983 family)
MKCPNCGSTKIIADNIEYCCRNCGKCWEMVRADEIPHLYVSAVDLETLYGLEIKGEMISIHELIDLLIERI